MSHDRLRHNCITAASVIPGHAPLLPAARCTPNGYSHFHWHKPPPPLKPPPHCATTPATSPATSCRAPTTRRTPQHPTPWGPASHTDTLLLLLHQPGLLQPCHTPATAISPVGRSRSRPRASGRAAPPPPRAPQASSRTAGPACTCVHACVCVCVRVCVCVCMCMCMCVCVCVCSVYRISSAQVNVRRGSVHAPTHHMGSATRRACTNMRCTPSRFSRP